VVFFSSFMPKSGNRLLLGHADPDKVEVRINVSVFVEHVA
jgi:hypothetical protein